MKLSCALLLACAISAAVAYKSYDGYQVLKTLPVPEFAIPALAKLQDNPSYDFWTRIKVGHPVYIMASAQHIEILRDALHRLRLAPTVHIPDVGVTVRNEREQNEAAKRSHKLNPKAADYTRFMEYPEIQAFLDEVVAANPSLASIVDLGTTTEGRNLRGIKLSSGSGKPNIWIDCAIHAREWIAPPMCMRLIEEVVATASLQSLADWYIVPVANPDGYAYSFSDERFWRKTRRPNPGSSCVGTDPNRNYDLYWNSDNNQNECSETFPGSSAFSEPECDAMGNLMDSLGANGNLRLYIAMHSYGPMIIYPWGHTTDPAPNAADLDAAGQAAASAITSAGGPSYDVGPSGESLYFTYGASDDYAYGVSGAVFSYTYELPGGGSGGFNPPPSAIQGVVDETTPGVLAMVDYVFNSKKH